MDIYGERGRQDGLRQEIENENRNGSKQRKSVLEREQASQTLSHVHTGTPVADIILRPPAFSPSTPILTDHQCQVLQYCLWLFPSIFPLFLSCSFSLSFPSNSFVFVEVSFFFSYSLIVVLSGCGVVYLWPSFYSFILSCSVAFIFIISMTIALAHTQIQ